MRGVSQAIPGGPFLPAPCQWGWDWGPMLPPIGIWKELRLEGYTGACLGKVHLRQRHDAGRVFVTAHVMVESLGRDLTSLACAVTVTAPDGQVMQQSARVGPDGAAAFELPIEDPQLWWPNGYGEQPLYDVVVSLTGASGEALDQSDYRIGLRTIELALVRHTLPRRERRQHRATRTTGTCGTAAAVHRLSRPVSAFHERVRLPGAAAAGDDRDLRRRIDWNMTAYIMEHHQRSGSGNGLMIGQMTDTYRMPKDFPSLVYLSMMLQAEGIRYGVEHWRRHMESHERHALLAAQR